MRTVLGVAIANAFATTKTISKCTCGEQAASGVVGGSGWGLDVECGVTVASREADASEDESADDDGESDVALQPSALQTPALQTPALQAAGCCAPVAASAPSAQYGVNVQLFQNACCSASLQLAPLAGQADRTALLTALEGGSLHLSTSASATVGHTPYAAADVTPGTSGCVRSGCTCISATPVVDETPGAADETVATAAISSDPTDTCENAESASFALENSGEAAISPASPAPAPVAAPAPESASGPISAPASSSASASAPTSMPAAPKADSALVLPFSCGNGPRSSDACSVSAAASSPSENTSTAAAAGPAATNPGAPAAVAPADADRGSQAQNGLLCDPSHSAKPADAGLRLAGVEGVAGVALEQSAAASVTSGEALATRRFGDGASLRGAAATASQGDLGAEA
eukprot:6176858-Pleurochrysis_carterae.AAC.1